MQSRSASATPNLNFGLCLCAIVVFLGLAASVAVLVGATMRSSSASVSSVRAMTAAHVAPDMLECPTVARAAYDASTAGAAHMLGAVGVPQLRLVADAPLRTCTGAADSRRPNARAVSNALFAQRAGTPRSTLSGAAWSFGQFIDHTIVLTRTRAATSRCPALRIATDGDADFGARGPIEAHPTALEYDAASGTFAPVAGISNFVDASSVYGSSAARAYHLRTFVGGELRMTRADVHAPGAETLPNNTAGIENVGGDENTAMFLAGDVRASEQAPLAAWHTVWAREHNWQARRLRATRDFARASDECVFQAARSIVAAELQRATFDDFATALLGGEPLAPWRAYNASIDARVSVEFAGAAYRLGHSMVTDDIPRADPASGAPLAPLALRRAFKRPDALLRAGVDEVLAGALTTRAERVDARVVDALRQHLFEDEGAPLDLVALNIERGRELGIAGFARLRAHVLGADAPPYVARVADDVATLRATYGATLDDVDAYVGLLVEAPARPTAVLGRTLEAMVRDQFARLRDGDPRYYRALGDAALVRYVDSADGSLRAIVARTTRITADAALARDNLFVAQ